MAEVGVKLTGSNAEFKAMMSDSISYGGQAASQLANKVSERMVGMREVGMTLASALGLNITNIADGVARFLTGMTKEMEASYKQLDAMSTQLADQSIAEMRSRMTNEQQISALEKDRVSTQNKIADARQRELGQMTMVQNLAALLTGGAMGYLLVKHNEAAIEKSLKDNVSAQSDLIKINTDLEAKRTAEKQKQIQIDDMAAQMAKAQEDHDVKSLGYTEQMAAAQKNLTTDENLLASSKVGTTEEMKRALQVQKDSFALSDLQLAHEQAGRLAIKDQEEEAILLAKAKKPITDAEQAGLEAMVQSVISEVKESANLSGVEQTRLEILALQTQEKKNQRDIGEILKKGVENLTPEEMRQVELIDGQNKEIDKQIAQRQTILSTNAPMIETEKQKTDLLNRQTEINQILSKGVGALTEQDVQRLQVLAGQDSVLQQQISQVQDLTRQFEGLRVSITRTGTDYQSQSTTALQGVRARLEEQLHAPSTNSGMELQNATINSDYGAFVTAQTLKSEIQNIDQELSMRSTVAAYAQKYGQSAAVYKFGDADTQRALQDLQSAQTQTVNVLSTISQQLSASGFFPKNLSSHP